jgi:methyl-accepting chemotaxis protein
MQTLFAPAVALMNRLRYRSKFLLLGTALTVVLGVLLFRYYLLSRDIQTAQNELNGLQMIKPLNRMAQFMQQHRGLSSGVLNGNEAMKDKRAAKEKEVVEAVVAADASLSPALRENQIWKSVRQDWEEIRAQGLSWSAPDNIKRHTQMIAKALQFMAEVADANNLTLDPAMDTYYFMDTVVSKMPAMLEQLGITRARGTGVDQEGTGAPDEDGSGLAVGGDGRTAAGPEHQRGKGIPLCAGVAGGAVRPGQGIHRWFEKLFRSRP